MNLVLNPISSEDHYLTFASVDFFGLLFGCTTDQKKVRVLDTYKLIFRFSIGKLMNYLKEDSFILILI